MRISFEARDISKLEKIKKELLGGIFEAFLNEEMDSEVLKLKILEAMTTPEP